jgi:hypothetical protein
LQIYEEARVRGERQEDVAARHGLTQQRVSEICAQVERWRQSLASTPDYEAIDADERRRRLLAARQREETILLVALRQAVAERDTIVSERRVTTAEGTQVTRTEKVMPVNPQWLKIAQAASQSLTRMNESLGVDVQTSALAEEIARLWAELLGEESEGERSCEGADAEPRAVALPSPGLRPPSPKGRGIFVGAWDGEHKEAAREPERGGKLLYVL